LGDFNGDGLADLWETKDRSDRHIPIWLNAGGGRFVARSIGRAVLPGLTAPPFKHHTTAVVDYDANGRSDLLENWQFSRDFSDGTRETTNLNGVLLPDSVVRQFEGRDAPDLIQIFPDDNPPRTAPGAFDVSGDVDGDGNIDLFGKNELVFFG